MSILVSIALKNRMNTPRKPAKQISKCSYIPNCNILNYVKFKLKGEGFYF